MPLIDSGGYRCCRYPPRRGRTEWFNRSEEQEKLRESPPLHKDLFHLAMDSFQLNKL